MEGGAAAASNPMLPEKDATGINPQAVLPLVSSVGGTQTGAERWAPGGPITSTYLLAGRINRDRALGALCPRAGRCWRTLPRLLQLRVAEMLFLSRIQLQGAASSHTACSVQGCVSPELLRTCPSSRGSAGVDVQTLLGCLLSCDTTLKRSVPGPSRPASVPPLGHSTDAASSNGEKAKKKVGSPGLENDGY